MIAIINEPVKEKVKRYTIMHEDAPVLEFNRETDEIYNVLAKDSKNANIIRGLQRMFVFNYIIANPDLHDDNYGLLYDRKTFEFKAVVPCYDHNVAFQEGFLGLTRTTMGNSASPLSMAFAKDS